MMENPIIAAIEKYKGHPSILKIKKILELKIILILSILLIK